MAYIGNSPGVASQRVTSTFTATAGQTTFTPISGYTLGYCDVYYNGVKLVDGDDYTASNGVTVVLTNAAAVGDSVEIVTHFPRGLSDGYTQSEANARYAQRSNNLSDLSSASTARTNLGLSAVAASGSASDLSSGTLPVARLNTSTDYTINGLRVGRGGGDLSTNTVAGAGALSANTTGSHNVAIGFNAMDANAVGNWNIAVGANALSNFAALAGTGRNIAIGNDCLRDLTTGTNNTVVGDDAGYLMTTGSKNTIVGRYNGNQSGFDIRTASNHVVLSDGDGNPLIRAYGLTGQVTLQQVGYGNNFPAFKQSGFGYSQSAYGALVIGAPVGWNQTVSINYDPSGNASGSFSGTGGEVMFRNAVRFIQPNATNNGYHPILQFDSSGYGFKSSKSIGVGDADPSTSGAGITFPATQSASSDANTLDDYEEGTWTPTISSNSGVSNITVGTHWYRKVGSLVVVCGNLNYASASVGNCYVVLSLPFSAASNTDNVCGVCNSYPYDGNRQAGIVIDNSSGDPNNVYVACYVSSTNAGTILWSLSYRSAS